MPEDKALMASLKNDAPKTTVTRESESLQAKTSPIKAVFASNDKDNDIVSAGDSNDDLATHVLMLNPPTKGGTKGEVLCHLCKLVGMRKSTTLSCVDCGKGFRMNCFVVVHHLEAVKTHWLELYELAMHVSYQKAIRNVKRSAYVGE